MSDDFHIGPQRAPATYTCNGCKHLHIEDWREYMYEDDAWDRGTSATCNAVPTDTGGKHISSYWSKQSRPPKWCPYLIDRDNDIRDAGDR